MKATEVTAGLAESNDSLLPGLWRDSFHVTCGLTACTPGSAPAQRSVTSMGKLYFTFYMFGNLEKKIKIVHVKHIKSLTYIAILIINHNSSRKRRTYRPVGGETICPPPAGGSSTRGGSKSIRGRVRSPHLAKMQAANVFLA